MEPNSNRLQKPIGGLLVIGFFQLNNMLYASNHTINKGAIVFSEHIGTVQNHKFKMEKSIKTWLKLYVVDTGFVNIYAPMVPSK